MINPVFVVDVIGEVVTKTKAAIITKPSTTLLQTIVANEAAVQGSSSIQTINYQYGHYNELIETLQQYNQSREESYNKYPLIWLRTDFRERRGQEQSVYAEVYLNIIIAHHTEQTLKSTERKTKVFEPVLYPIYYEFLHQLYKHIATSVQSDEMISHDKYDRYYWGTQEMQKTTDFVDAIEIDNLALKIYYKTC